MIKAVGAGDTAQLVDLTEQCLKKTDKLIVEFRDFLENFPILVKSSINQNGLDKFSKILTYSFDETNKGAMELAQPVPTPDQSILVAILGQTQAETHARY